MITLNASGGSVTFTFSGNSTYLNDGTITVPVNSLALIIDESDMATFRKSASNDIFVSANVSEFGMTKAELESWYKDNMVGSTGGGGGVTSGEVQTMIDESISGKVDTEDLDISGKTLYTKWYSSADYTWGQTYDIDSHPTAVVVRFTSTYSTSASPLIFVFSDGTTEATRTLSIVGDGAGNILSASFDSEFSNAVLSVVDGLLYITLTDGYYIKQLTMSSADTNLKYPSMSIESGSTPTVVEQGVYDVLEDLNDRANAAEAKLDKALQAEMYFNVGTSGLTITTYPLSGTSAQYKSVGLNDSLWGDADGVLGVYATGSTKHAVAINRNFNSTSAPIPEYLKPCYEVVMHKNPYYSGSAPTTRAIRVYYLDSSDNQFNQDYTYNSGTDSFTNATSNTGVTLTYDNVANTITLTLDPSYKTITSAGSNKGVAPSTAITNPPSYIGLVTIDSNSYKLQEAIDNKQDTLSAGTGISISGNVISATGGGGGTDAPISAGTGTNSVKENYVNNVASGSYSHAEGNGTSAEGNYAHAEGHQTSASGSSSHAEGELTNANGSNSHAEGTSTKANGSNSHAEGKYSQASGQTSHAEGDNTRANGTKSHAEGGSTVANGSNSHAEGSNTIANNQAEHASGMYNVSNTGESTSAQTLFSVGNGGWDEAAQDVVRHNAFEIRQNGDIYLNNGTSDVKLQDYIQIKVVKLTQQEYDALSPNYDNNTLYVIS